MLWHLVDVAIRSMFLGAIAATLSGLLRRRMSFAMQHTLWTAVACGMLALFVAGPALPGIPR